MDCHGFGILDVAAASSFGHPLGRDPVVLPCCDSPVNLVEWVGCRFVFGLIIEETTSTTSHGHWTGVNCGGRRVDIVVCMLHQSSMIAKLIFIAMCYDAITDSPLPELLPPSACHQSVDIIPLTPDVVLFDIRLLLFSIANPLIDLIGYCFMTELREPRCDGGERFGWEIPGQHTLK